VAISLAVHFSALRERPWPWPSTQSSYAPNLEDLDFPGTVVSKKAMRGLRTDGLTGTAKACVKKLPERLIRGQRHAAIDKPRWAEQPRRSEQLSGCSSLTPTLSRRRVLPLPQPTQPPAPLTLAGQAIRDPLQNTTKLDATTLSRLIPKFRALQAQRRSTDPTLPPAATRDHAGFRLPPFEAAPRAASTALRTRTCPAPRAKRTGERATLAPFQRTGDHPAYVFELRRSCTASPTAGLRLLPAGRVLTSAKA